MPNNITDNYPSYNYVYFISPIYHIKLNLLELYDFAILIVSIFAFNYKDTDDIFSLPNLCKNNCALFVHFLFKFYSNFVQLGNNKHKKTPYKTVSIYK